MELEPREYSKRLGSLTSVQLRSALARFELGEPWRQSPLRAGSSDRTSS